MRVTGLDLSLTSTGMAQVQLGVPGAFTFRLKPPTALCKAGREHERLQWLLGGLAEHTRGTGLALLEGPSHASENSQQHKLGGLWWMCAHGLYRRGVPYAVVPPGSLKKYATGSGSAGKDQVVIAVTRRYPEVEVADNNEADALVLAAMGADYLGFPLVAVPAVHRQALTGVKWPLQVAELRRDLHGTDDGRTGTDG